MSKAASDSGLGALLLAPAAPKSGSPELAGFGFKQASYAVLVVRVSPPLARRPARDFVNGMGTRTIALGFFARLSVS